MDSNEEKVAAINMLDIPNSLNSTQSSDPKVVSLDLIENAMHTETSTTENGINNIQESSVNLVDGEKCDKSIKLNHSNDKQACASYVTSSYDTNLTDCLHDTVQNTQENSNTCGGEFENKNVCDLQDKSIDDSDKTSNKNNRKSKSSEVESPAVTGALSQLLEYGMSDSEDSESDSVSISDSSDTNSDISDEIADKSNTNNKSDICDADKFRENDSSSDSSTYYDSDSSESADNGACAITPVSNNKQKAKTKMAAVVTRGELTLDDLPPIEQLQISLPEQDCVQIGVVSSIVEQLVIVQSLPGMPAYDIDTLLFLDKGVKPLGRIFDVLGPVTEPFYAVRFNSFEQASEAGIKPGVPVFCAPYNSEHTAYVFVSELLKMKGSDASWKHNNEPPEAYLEYSDDEQEAMARRIRSGKFQPDTIKTNSLERNKKFERQMNNKNTLMNQRFNRPSTSRRPEEPRLPTVPQSWNVPQAPRPVRPEFCLPYGYFNQYGNFPVMPQFGMAPMMGQGMMGNLFPAFNPHLPPPMMRAQPVSYFPNPRHPRWGPPGPHGNFGNGSQ